MPETNNDNGGASSQAGAPPKSPEPSGLIGIAQKTLKDAIALVPAIKYALGVAGLGAAAFITSIFFGLDLGKAFIAVIAMSVMMFVVIVIAWAAKNLTALKPAAVFLSYAYIALAVVIPTLLVSS